MAELLTLAEFLRDGAARPFEWGQCDCSLWPADWVATRVGFDPAADLRGTYATRRGAIRQILAGGGLPWLFGPRAERCGMTPTRRPMPGDIGVVHAPAGIVGAIRTGRGWAVKREFGVIVASFESVMAWTIDP